MVWLLGNKTAVQTSTILRQNGSQCTGKHVGHQMKNARQNKCRFKAMLTVFTNINSRITEN